MDLNKLRVFKCVAEVGKINVASSELKIASSAISVAISNLESDLDVKLFTRHYKGMKLTKHGQSLYASAKKIFDEVDTVTKNIREDKSSSISGKLTIATSQGIASTNWFNYRIATLSEYFPEVCIEITNYSQGRLETQEADIFICPKMADRPDLIQKKIKEFSFNLFASKQYINNFGFPKSVNDLDNHRLISFSPKGKNPFNDVDSILHLGRNSNNPRAVFLYVNNSVGMLKLVKMGVGIGALHLTDSLEHDLITVLPDKAQIIIPTFFVFNKNSKNQDSINAAFNFF